MGKDINSIPVYQDERLINIFSDIHKNNSSQRVCFIIGSGASISSGIPHGEKLAKQWLEKIKETILDGEDYNSWVKEKSINEKYPGESYSEIYIKRFEDSKEIGYDFINNTMQGKEPNIGYLFLGELLNHKEHNTVITTNFDNLIERSIYTYQSVEPLVCAHENMAAYARPADGRPLIAKIHRDKLFDPINDPEGVGRLDAKWEEPLTNLLNDKIVVCLGYGGNDGSLMGLLEGVPFNKGIYWCILENSEPSQRVQTFLKDKKGKLVEITDFDEFIFKLWNEINSTVRNIDFETKIDKISKKRKENFSSSILKLKEKSKNKNDEELEEAFDNFAKNQNANHWWIYQIKVNNAKTNDEKEKIYLEGLSQLPDSPELNGNYANFLNDIRKDYDTAEKHYKKALELEPDDAGFNGNYAIFLKDIRKDYNAAEKHYKKALELEPDDAGFNGNYANFLKDILKDYDAAEKHYKKALELEPDSANKNGNYASFLLGKGEKEQARSYLNKAFKNCNHNTLLIELWFYRYAHYPEYLEEAYNKLVELIEQGVRSPGWNFDDNITQAEKEGHPNIKKLKRLAKIITEV